MGKVINVVYGILTDGDSTYRKTSVSRIGYSKTITALAEALVPGGFSKEAKRGLAELYIRLIMTDKGLYDKLLKIDPINSYKLHAIYEDFTGVNLADIVDGIKKLGLADEERSFLPVDFIINGLDKLLNALDR